MWTESGDYIQEMAMASSAPQNLHAVFVYGSLLADEVVAVLLNRVPQSSAAVLHNLSVSPFTLSLVFSFGFWTCDFSISILVLASFDLLFIPLLLVLENNLNGYCYIFDFCSYKQEMELVF